MFFWRFLGAMVALCLVGAFFWLLEEHKKRQKGTHYISIHDLCDLNSRTSRYVKCPIESYKKSRESSPVKQSETLTSSQDILVKPRRSSDASTQQLLGQTKVSAEATSNTEHAPAFNLVSFDSTETLCEPDTTNREVSENSSTNHVPEFNLLSFDKGLYL